jgi:hypothetical protein
MAVTHWNHIKNKSHAFKMEHKWIQWIIEFIYRTIHKKNLPFIDHFDFVLLAFKYKTLIFPTESGLKWLSSMFLITFPWEQMKVQLLLRLQVTALSTWCQTNLHPSMAWGDFIKANSFASASSISIDQGYGIELDQIGTQYLYMENVSLLNQ